MSTLDISTVTGFRYLFLVLSQLVSGFCTSMLALYGFFAYTSGTHFLFAYVSQALPSITSGDPILAGFVILFGLSPFVAIGSQFVRRKYKERGWMRSTREMFFLGLLVGIAFVTLYTFMLMMSLAPEGTYGPAGSFGCGRTCG